MGKITIFWTISQEYYRGDNSHLYLWLFLIIHIS